MRHTFFSKNRINTNSYRFQKIPGNNRDVGFRQTFVAGGPLCKLERKEKEERKNWPQLAGLYERAFALPRRMTLYVHTARPVRLTNITTLFVLENPTDTPQIYVAGKSNKHQGVSIIDSIVLSFFKF